MSYKKHGDEYEMFCDGCSFSESFEADNFKNFINKAKRAGWSIVYDGEHWLHFCEDHKDRADAARRDAKIKEEEDFKSWEKEWLGGE